jgi:hypothetical protein
LLKDSESFEAKLITLDGKRLATGSDFDENTGQIAAGRDVVLLNETEANAFQTRSAGGCLDGRQPRRAALDPETLSSFYHLNLAAGVQP